MGLGDLVLHVEAALLVFSLALADSEACFAKGRVEASAIDRDVDGRADLATEIALRFGRLPECVVTPEHFHIGMIVFARQFQTRLFGTESCRKRGKIGPL